MERVVRLSIVTTLYRSAPFVEEFYRRAVAAAEAIMPDFEIVFVDDGSPDHSLDIVLSLHDADKRVVVVDLSRNFGHHRAMMTGLREARGDLVFLIDVDLEADPEELVRFAEKLDGNECDVVYGVQEKRSGSFFERVSGEIFYWAVGRLGGVPAARNLTTTRLMTRRYVRNLIRHRERELVISGLWASTGFVQLPIPVVRHERKAKTSYGLFKKLRLAIDYITSFSADFLYHVLYLGIGISLIAFVMLVLELGRYFVIGSPIAGWASLIVSVWLFGGVNILMTGLIGLYVARIFKETKRRPYTIIRKVYRE